MSLSTTASLPPSYYCLFVSSGTRSLSLRRRSPVIVGLSNLRCSGYRPLRLSASTAEGDLDLDLSWVSGGPSSDSDFNGWALVESPPKEGKKGLPAIVIGTIGTSLAVLLAVIAGYSLSRNGYKFRFFEGLHSWSGWSNWTRTGPTLSKDIESGLGDGKNILLEESPDNLPDSVSEIGVSEHLASKSKPERLVLPLALDSTQQEAVMVLKRLKIMEEHIRGDELCTRREYARWLVLINSSLERNPKNKVVPSVLLSACEVAAFDDVSVEDPDFQAIQALAEAGIVHSKLSAKNSSSVFSDSSVSFFPERFISRQDLMSWRVQLEYNFVPGLEEEISKKKVCFMDMKEFSPDIPEEFFMDLLTGDGSIVRKVFGQSKRFQPSKPSTKAQAAVALTSGRMMSAIHTELSRLEAENISRLVEMEEMRSELIEKGDIKRHWDEKLTEEKNRGVEVYKDYLAAVDDLKEEKIIQEKTFQEHMKERAALDCQKQLIVSLKEEVDEMSERLASERTIYVAEQCETQDTISNLEIKQEGILDTKSIVGAKREAVRILRSWVEDEARNSQARAKVLEEVGRRWKWDGHA